MSDLSFRPRFKFHSELSKEELSLRLTNYAETSASNHIKLKKVRDHFTLEITDQFKHFWSPHMDVNIEHDPDENRTLVRCMIGPTPAVWTMFMFFYGFFGFLGFVGLTLGLSQWTLKKDMWGWWFLPLALLGMGLMYFISYEGKKLSRDEMISLKGYVDNALECDCFIMSEEQGHV